MARLNVNGVVREVDAEPDTPLLWVIREQIGLTGTKYGCGIAQCGACTVHIDGEAVRSCSLPVSAAEGKQITTIEGLAEDGRLHPLQQAFIDYGGFQCGICTPGQIMAAKALLDQNPHPSQAEIKEWMMGNLCRCTGYYKILDSVKAAAGAEA